VPLGTITSCDCTDVAGTCSSSDCTPTSSLTACGCPQECPQWCVPVDGEPFCFCQVLCRSP
jgi:hypothetical protein